MSSLDKPRGKCRDMWVEPSFDDMDWAKRFARAHKMTLHVRGREWYAVVAPVVILSVWIIIYLMISGELLK